MKKLLILTLLTLLAGIVQAQSFALPKFLLIQQATFFLTVSSGYGITLTSSPTSITDQRPYEDSLNYEYTAFNSVESVKEYLKDRTDTNVIGLWEVTTGRIIPIKLNVTHHQKEEKIKVEVKEWDEYKWEIKNK